MAGPEPLANVPNKINYGDRTLIDLTEDTVTPATLKSGVTAHDASGAKITGTLDTTQPEESDINFWDYDGTLLYAWTLAELATKTELPPLPSHDGLVCQGWNWTLQDIKDAGRELDIGALYITDDGKTRLYVDVDTETWDDFVLWYWQSVANAVTVDWGDGSNTETGQVSGDVTLTHVYQAAGKYMITMDVSDGAYARLNTLLARGVADYNQGRMAMLEKAEIGARVNRIDFRAFFAACRMKSITIPTGVTFSGNRIFEQCTSLSAIVLPTILNQPQSFYNATQLKIISLCKGNDITAETFITNTGVSRLNGRVQTADTAQSLLYANITTVNGVVGRFNGCRALLEVTIPADATTFLAAAFQGDNALRRVTCLGDIASIPAQVFQRCFPLRFVDLTHCTAVPTLANVNAFDQTHEQLEIRVPASLVAEWKAATNWSSLADHIVGV